MNNKSMINNCRSEGFGIQRFEDVMLRILAESIVVFA